VIVKSKSLPKKGTRKATQTVDATRTVLRRMKHQYVVEILSGSNSSKLLASGFSNRAYVFTVKERLN